MVINNTSDDEKSSVGNQNEGFYDYKEGNCCDKNSQLNQHASQYQALFLLGQFPMRHSIIIILYSILLFVLVICLTKTMNTDLNYFDAKTMRVIVTRKKTEQILLVCISISFKIKTIPIRYITTVCFC